MDINDEVFAKTRLLVKEELSSEEETFLAELCAMACTELMGRLKEEVSITDIHDIFVRAAATLSLAMFLESQTGQVQSFSAGSLSIRRRDNGQGRTSADLLRKQAELMLVGYLKDRGFGFKAVRG